MTDFEIPSRPDVTEMAAVHRVYRNAFAMAPQLVGGVDDGDVARAEVVGAFYADILEFLHLHHEGEDELLFPKLVARVPDPELVTRIAGQHALVHDGLEASNASVAAWRTTGSAADRDRLLAALTALEAAALPHLDEEEEKILPLVSEHITLEEW